MKFAAEPLPFTPESFEAMCQRWSHVLVPRYQIALVEAGRQMSPAFQRQHVFDFPDGIQLIAAVEETEDGFELHLSFGIHSSFHSVWIPAGKEKFLRRCRALVEQFQLAGCIRGKNTSLEITNRAYHFWFTL